MMTIKSNTVVRAAVGADLAPLTGLLTRSVEDGASVGFLAPLSPDVARRYWQNMLAESAEGRRLLLVACTASGQVLGTVQLEFCFKENGNHRAEVQKLMVDPAARRQGIARDLLAEVEAEARQERLSLLVLDTASGSDAEKLYQSEGWQFAGSIPAFALDARSRELQATSLYWKRL